MIRKLMLPAVFSTAQATLLLGFYMRLPMSHLSRPVVLMVLYCHGILLDSFWMLHHDTGIGAKKDAVLLALTFVLSFRIKCVVLSEENSAINFVQYFASI